MPGRAERSSQASARELETTRFIALLRDSAPELVRRYRVKSLGIFGSYARREQHRRSDLDILVDFADPPSLIRFIEMENSLTDLLGVRVDLVMRDALKPGIREHILNEVIPI